MDRPLIDGQAQITKRKWLISYTCCFCEEKEKELNIVYGEYARITICRILAALIWSLCVIIEIFIHIDSSVSPVSGALNAFIFVGYEIATILYASTSITFKVSYCEMVIFAGLPLFLAFESFLVPCFSSLSEISAFILPLKGVLLLLAAHFVAFHVRRRQDWTDQHKIQSAAVINQAFLFVVSILFTMAEGIRVAWETAVEPDPHCFFNKTDCGFPDLYHPVFKEHEDFSCEVYWERYLSMREIIRLLRDLYLLNIVSHAVGDSPLLGIKTCKCEWNYVPLTVLRILYFAVMFCGIWVLNINPFGFPYPFKLVVDVIELFLFATSIVWMWCSPSNNTNLPHFSLLPQAH